MAFANEFTNNLSAIVGNPTRAIEYNQLARNSDANKERFIQGHHFNNIGIVGEDGYHFGDYSNPLWMYSKSTGNSTAKYSALWVNTEDANPHLRVKIQSTTAAISAIDAGSIFGIDVQPEGTTGRLIVSNNTQLLAEDNLLYESSNMSGALVFYDLNASNATGSIVGQIAFTDTSDHVENNVVIGSIGFQKSKDNNVGSEIFFINGVKGTSGGSPIVVNIENIRMSTFGTSIKTLLVGNTSEISTSAPSNILEVSSSSAANVMALRTTSTDGAYMQIYESATKLGEIGAVKGILTSSSSSTDIGIKAVGGIHLATNGDNTRILIDTTGAIGIGKTPDTWHSNNISRLQLNANGNIFTRSEGLYSTSNFYYDASDAGRFQENGYAISQSHNTSTGQILFSFSTSSNSSGAGALASIATTMAVEPSAVGINTTTPNAPLAVASKASTYEGMELITPSGDANGFFQFGVHDSGGSSGRGIQFRRGGSDGFDTLSLEVGNGGGFKVFGQNFVHATNALSIGQEGSGLAQLRAYGPDSSTMGSYEFAQTSNDGSVSSRPLVIDNTGRVGIGTSSPAQLLEINGGSGPATIALRDASVSAHYMHIRKNDDQLQFVDTSNDGTTDRNIMMVIDSLNGTGNNVGIGTSSPHGPLTVKPATNENLSIVGGSGDLRLSALNDAQSATVQLSIQGDPLYIRGTGGVIKTTFLGNGNVGIGTVSPTHKLTVEDTSGSVVRLNGINNYNYDIESHDNGQLWDHEIGSGTPKFSWSSSTAELMRLDTTGLGIGTNSPTAPVDINTSGNTHLIFKYQDSSTQRSFIATNAGVSTNYNGLVIGSNATQQGTQANTGLSSWYQRLGPTDATGDAWSVAYQSAGGSVVERVRITSAGRIGIGVTDPQSNLELEDSFAMRANGLNVVKRNIVKQVTGTGVVNAFQLSIPARYLFVYVKMKFAGSRAPSSNVGTSTVGEYYYAIGRNGSGSDVVLDSDVGSQNWSSATTSAGGSLNAVTVPATTIVRNGAEANTAAQVVNITLNVGVTGSSTGLYICDFEVMILESGTGGGVTFL